MKSEEQDPNNCHDPSAWSDWEERTAQHPEDTELHTLHALWMGLCVKIDQGAIAFEQAMVIFERAREALFQQRRPQRKEGFIPNGIQLAACSQVEELLS